MDEPRGKGDWSNDCDVCASVALPLYCLAILALPVAAVIWYARRA